MKEFHIEFEDDIKLEPMEQLVIVIEMDSHGPEINDLYVMDEYGAASLELEWKRWSQK